MRVVGTEHLKLCGHCGEIFGILLVGGIIERAVAEGLGEEVVAQDGALGILDVFGVDVALEFGERHGVGGVKREEFLLEGSQVFGLRRTGQVEVGAKLGTGTCHGELFNRIYGEVDVPAVEGEAVDFGRGRGG